MATALGATNRTLRLSLGDTVHLRGTQIFCRAEPGKEPEAGPLMECFEKRDGWARSYEVGISERFVWVEQHISARTVRLLLTRQQHH